MRGTFLDYPRLEIGGEGKDVVLPVWLKPQREGWQAGFYNPTGRRLKLEIGLEGGESMVYAEEVSPLGMTVGNLDFKGNAAVLVLPPKSVKCAFLACR